MLHKGGSRLFSFREKAGYPPLQSIPPSTLFGQFPPDPELRYLACENQGYPDLHQVVSNVIIAEINKNVFFVGAQEVFHHYF